MTEDEMGSRVRELAHAFDQAFANPEPGPPPRMESYVVVAVGPDRLALPVDALGGLLAGRTIVPLPSDLPALLGLVGHRGLPVQVFGLALLLGRAAPCPAPWIVLSSGDAPVGLAVDRLESYVAVPPDSRIELERPIDRSRYIKQSLRYGEGAIEAVDVRSLVASLCTR